MIFDVFGKDRQFIDRQHQILVQSHFYLKTRIWDSGVGGADPSNFESSRSSADINAVTRQVL